MHMILHLHEKHESNISDLLFKVAMISSNPNWHIKYALHQLFSQRYSGFNFGSLGMTWDKEIYVSTPIHILNQMKQPGKEKTFFCLFMSVTVGHKALLCSSSLVCHFHNNWGHARNNLSFPDFQSIVLAPKNVVLHFPLGLSRYQIYHGQNNSQ